jgi:hypothetical protein
VQCHLRSPAPKRRSLSVTFPCSAWAKRPTLVTHVRLDFDRAARVGRARSRALSAGSSGRRTPVHPPISDLPAADHGHRHSGSGSEPPGQRTRPVAGLRLRPLPPCADPRSRSCTTTSRWSTGR